MRYFAPLFLALMTLLASTEAAAPMPKVVIYTLPGCFGCSVIKSMLDSRDIKFEEIEIDVINKLDVYKEMIRKTGGRKTLPQVFVNDKYIGGYKDVSGSYLDALKDGKNPESGQNSEPSS